MAEWIGRMLSKVEVQKLLGRGGMADVYLGRHTTLNRMVAVKVLQSHLSDDENLLGRFRSEAQAVATMRHPNIVQVFDFDVAEDRPYMIMELLEGFSLKDYLNHLRQNNLRLQPEVISRLISMLAAALDYAHVRGIVHRDIKSANIMLRSESGSLDLDSPLPPDVEPVLTDFGVARIANAAAQTSSGTILGTPAYMSPEQVQGFVVDGRSDIYSLGIVLYEMLTGQLPFDSDTQASILLKHITEPPPPLPPERAFFQSIIDRVLAKEPDRRFQKASDLASALDVRVNGLQTPADSVLQEADGSSTIQITRDTTPVGSSTAVRPAARLNRLWWIALVVALVVVGGIVGLTLMQRDGGEVSSVSQQETATAEATLPPVAEITESMAGTAVPVMISVGDGPVGQVVFRNEVIDLTLEGVPNPPEGFAYEAWLTGPEVVPLSLGMISLEGGSASLQYTDPEGDNPLKIYNGIAISLEPAPDSDPAVSDSVIYEAQIAPEIIQRVRLLIEVSGSGDIPAALLDGINSQVGHYDSHLRMQVDAIKSGDLMMGKRHAEHVIAISVGREGPEYSDWDDNGRIENPGDEVGLRVYLQILRDMLGTAGGAEAVIGEVDRLLKNVDDAVRLSERIATSDALEEITGLVPDLEALYLSEAVASLVQQVSEIDLVVSAPVVPLP